MKCTIIQLIENLQNLGFNLINKSTGSLVNVIGDFHKISWEIFIIDTPDGEKKIDLFINKAGTYQYSYIHDKMIYSRNLLATEVKDWKVTRITKNYLII